MKGKKCLHKYPGEYWVYNGCINLRFPFSDPSLQGPEPLPTLEILTTACISFGTHLWGWQDKKWPLQSDICFVCHSFSQLDELFLQLFYSFWMWYCFADCAELCCARISALKSDLPRAHFVVICQTLVAGCHRKLEEDKRLAYTHGSHGHKQAQTKIFPFSSFSHFPAKCAGLSDEVCPPCSHLQHWCWVGEDPL